MDENIKQKLKDLADYEAAEKSHYQVKASGSLLLRHLTYEEMVRRVLLQCWCKNIGWKRFFVLDWWWLKLNIKPRRLK